MERNAKHGPRVDEQLSHEVQGLVTGTPDEGRKEWRRQEAGGDGEPEPVVHPHVDGSASVPDESEVERRSALAAALPPSIFPATAGALAKAAGAAFAPPDLVASIGGLPKDRTFDTVAEVWEALGHEVEHRGSGGGL